MEGLVLGLGSPSQLVRQIVEELRVEAAGGEGGGDGGRFKGLWGMAGEVADELDKALQLRGSCPEEAIAKLGRNCHMPNALTSPLQVRDDGGGGGGRCGGRG